MDSQPPKMNRETALRIALAARALPEVGVGRLLEILHQFKHPPTDLWRVDVAIGLTLTLNDTLLRGCTGHDWTLCWRWKVWQILL